MEKARGSQENIYFRFTDDAKACDCGSHKLWEILKGMEYQTTLPVSWGTCMQIKKQWLEPDMEQHSSSKLGKENNKAACWHPAYLTCAEYIMWSAGQDEAQTGIKIFQGEISTTSDMQMIPL